MRPNLVIVRSGRTSQHPRWLQGGDQRNWDLLLCPYEGGPGESDFPVPPAIAGPKWLGIRHLLGSSDIWRRYRYIWVPDDDLVATATEISRLFNLCKRFDAALAQPALTDQSEFTYPITMRNRSFFARATIFVENMAPCLRRDALERLLPTLEDAPTGWGWGLEYVWARMLQYRGIYVFDAVPVSHTRPVGSLRTQSHLDAALGDRKRMLDKYGVSPARASLHACDRDGSRIDLSEGLFLLRYLQGYQYLFERNPKLIEKVILDQVALANTTENGKERAGPKQGHFWLERWWRRLTRLPGANH